MTSKTIGIIVMVILIILLVLYVYARVKSKQGKMVITADPFDKFLIIFASILFFIAWCGGFVGGLATWQIVLLIIFGLMLTGSIIYSIRANRGNTFDTILSISSKIFIFVLTNIVLLIILIIAFISFMSIFSRSREREGTFIMEYDAWLDRWVGYRID